MRAGLLRERVTFQYYVKTRGESAEVIATWEDYHSCKADILSNRGSRKTVIEESTQVGSIELQVRKTKEIDEKMRIVYQGKKYKISYMRYNLLDRTYIINADLINE